MRQVLIAVVVLAILAGCRSPGSKTVERDPTPTTAVHPTNAALAKTEAAATPTPSPTVTSTATATHTTTPTPTPTPTPTAQPISVSGDPRSVTLMRGFELDETGCGLIDILDFPLNPPEGDGIARGGVDFGVYRSRYEQYHTGEDWWTSRGRRSFGTPVYSIGNGRVTYAAPLGWGRDQGVVIIRHTFEDGRQLLSFYGHLDPPSVTLRAGDCVKRGEQVGNIGQPRTPPHLHFEIRTHMPDEPGGGYWWQDPTLDGWLPPSETIWQERMAKSPGVQWLRAPKSRDFQAIGSQDDIFLILEGEQIIGLDAASGRQRWSFVPEIRTVTAALDSTGPIVYVSDRAGRVTAFRLPRLAVAEDAVDAEMPLEPLWQIDLDVVGTPELIPFPSGGFMLAARSHAVAVSSEGEILWQNDAFDRLSDWVRIGDRLVLSTMSREESLWIANEGGLRNWTDLSGGALTALQDRGLLLNSDGLFRLNPEDETDVLLSEWPNGGWQGSDVLGLEDGGALVTYVGRGDRRLIHFDAEGVVKWQYSFPDEAPGVPRLFDLGGTPFISVESQSGDGGTVSIYAIDSEQGQLTLLFSGGTRMVGGLTNTLYPSDFGTLFLRIGGGHLVSLDLDTALDRVANSTGSGP